MLKQAKSYEEFINNYSFSVEHCIGVQVHKPEEKLMSVEKFKKEFYKLLYSGNGLSYEMVVDYPNIKDEKLIIKLIETNQPLTISIKTK